MEKGTGQIEPVKKAYADRQEDIKGSVCAYRNEAE